MYQAELRGKLATNTENLEDILTSNVFGFFKYADRSVYLKRYLGECFGIRVSEREAEEAEFSFWPVFPDGTEPDVILLVGSYYLLFEAKYFSGFGQETEETRSQIERECTQGNWEAASVKKEFRFIAITADYYYEEASFADLFRKAHCEIIPPFFHWTNWQAIARFIFMNLAHQVRALPQELFASDLLELLERKRLRPYAGFTDFQSIGVELSASRTLFFEAETAAARGDFIGFIRGLPEIALRVPDTIFFEGVPNG